MEVNYDERKLTELLLYIAERLPPDTPGGATKLNKVLYFAVGTTDWVFGLADDPAVAQVTTNILDRYLA
jgi:hypothetical protein